jgi:hypothetical protein
MPTPAQFMVLAGGSGFSPSSIPGLVGFWDFGDPSTLFTDAGRTTPVSADGNSINGVTDKSGAGNHLVSTGTAPLYKVSILNGLSACLFGGAGALAKTTTVNYAQPNTIVVVGKHGDGVAGKHFFDGSTTGRHVVGTGAGPVWQMYAGTLLNGGVTNTNNNIFMAQFNGASSKLYVNGGAANVSGAAGAQAWGNAAGAGIHLGSDDSGATGLLPAASYIYAVFAYNALLSLAQLNTLGPYINSRWGLTWTTAT